MARISGVDIPREKRLEIALTYIFGIGRTRAREVCQRSGIDMSTRVRDLTDEEVSRLRNDIDALAELCKARGIAFFVDAIQGLGPLVIDVKRTPSNRTRPFCIPSQR